METLWFWIVATLLALYVIFDGFDLGAGIVHLYAARTDAERRRVLQSIGPVWDGNEVWLLAAGGTIFLAFPVLYAASFSGFYLPLMIVLWLLMIRGVALEFRHHYDNALWKPFWDGAFAVSSGLLAIFLGAALGNVMRGVPLGADRRFFLPLWTDFRVGPSPGILDWYTSLVGLAAFAVLTVHGGLWVSLKTDGALRERARRVVQAGWWPQVLLTVAITVATFAVQPRVPGRLMASPWGLAFPGLAVAGLLGIRWFAGHGDDRRAFLASCGCLAGMLASAAFGLYPIVLPSTVDPALSLDIRQAAAAGYGLRIALVWFIPGVLLAGAYVAVAYRRFAGKTQVETEGY